MKRWPDREIVPISHPQQLTISRHGVRSEDRVPVARIGGYQGTAARRALLLGRLVQGAGAHAGPVFGLAGQADEEIGRDAQAVQLVDRVLRR